MKGDKKVDDIKKALNELALKWVFQKEKGLLKGYIHYQGRLKLRTRQRQGTVEEYFLKSKLTGVKVSGTTKGVHQAGCFNYVMKIETRIEGPWQDGNSEEKKNLIIEEGGGVIEKDQIEKTPHPWQKDLIKILRNGDRDKINIIQDAPGENGKSTLVNYLVATGEAMILPPINDITKVVGFISASETKKIYVGDIPRSLNKNKRKLEEYMAGIEQVKTGLIYDWRYTSKVKIIPRPTIGIFTNNELNENAFSKNRMDKFKIIDHKLIKQIYT